MLRRQQRQQQRLSELKKNKDPDSHQRRNEGAKGKKLIVVEPIKEKMLHCAESEFLCDEFIAIHRQPNEVGRLFMNDR